MTVLHPYLASIATKRYAHSVIVEWQGKPYLVPVLSEVNAKGKK